MLTKIRDRASGWIAWIIVFLISIPFALWGVNEYFAGVDEISVAEVNGVEIDQQTYRTALEDQREALSRALGVRADPEVVNSPAFRRGVLDGLIQRTLLVSDAIERGYRVSDEQLRRYIQSAPQFQREGRFDSDLYRQVVSGYRYTATSFEERLRQENVLQQMQSGFIDSALVTKRDVDALLKVLQQKRRFQYVVVRPEGFRDEVALSDAEIEKDYEEKSSQYKTPEQLKVQYVRLRVPELRSEVSVSEDELKALYESNKARFTTPERRKASHILIRVADADNEERLTEARQQAEKLLAETRSGADFAELAKAHSEDPGSAAAGGDLGFVEKGAMVEPFEDALYKLNEGEVSEPVRTPFGYHLIKLTELVPQAQQTYEEVREQLAEEETRRQAEDLFLDRAETFRNLVYEHPETLEVVAQELNLPLHTSEWFSRNQGTEGDISSNPRVRNAAYSEEVYGEGLNSATLETDRDTLIALRKLDVKPEAVRPLEDVRDEIAETLKTMQAGERARALSEELLDKLKAGQDWNALVAGAELEAQKAEITRAQPPTDISRALTEEIFRAGYPSQERPIFGTVSGEDGSYIVYRLETVEEGDPGTATDELRASVRQALARRRGQDLFLAYLEELRDNASITIFEEQL